MKAAMITILSLALAALPLVGCDNADEADDDTGTDADTDSDTDADTDSDTDSDTDTELDCDGGRLDPNTGLCWQDPVPDCGDCDAYYLYGIEYCDGLELAGHDDWFLPGLEDFMDLLGGCDDPDEWGEIDYCNPCEDSPACNAAFPGDQRWYWTSTEADVTGEFAWMVKFESGQLGISDGSGMNPPSTPMHVRCVRSPL
jgi:hypothetical protein